MNMMSVVWTKIDSDDVSESSVDPKFGFVFMLYPMQWHHISSIINSYKLHA